MTTGSYGASQTITFDEFPIGTHLVCSFSKQSGYVPRGVCLSTLNIVNDPAFSSNPVGQLDTIGRMNSLSATFVTPDAYPRPTKYISFDIGPFRGPNEVTISWGQFETSGKVRLLGTWTNSGAGVEHFSVVSDENIHILGLNETKPTPIGYPAWSIDNFTFDGIDAGSCPTVAGATAAASADCLCGDERDEIIDEYKKSYGTRASGNPLRIFDVNIDRYGNTPESYFVPTCNMFTQQLRTVHYKFAMLKDQGDGICSPVRTWALLANALVDTAESGRGLDKWVNEIIKDRKVVVTKKAPKLNSAYRTPARNLNCSGSISYGSRHMFGDAADLAVTGPDDKSRKKIALRWYELARLMASGDWFEDDKRKYPCSTSLDPGKRWRCAHVDWREEDDRFLPSTAAKIGLSVLAATLSFNTPASSADSPTIKEIQTLAASSNWQDRARAFAMLGLDIRLHDKKHSYTRKELQAVSLDTKKILVNLLQSELHPDARNEGEEEDEYFYSIMVAASLYARPDATPLLLSDDILPRGRAAWRAAARMGDEGVSLLLEKLKNHRGELYGDYIGVACMMRQLGTVEDPSNIRRVNMAITYGTKHPDHAVRYLAADCLKWVPKETSGPILLKLEAHDPHSSVREVAAKSLKFVMANKTDGKSNHSK